MASMISAPFTAYVAFNESHFQLPAIEHTPFVESIELRCMILPCVPVCSLATGQSRPPRRASAVAGQAKILGIARAYKRSSR